MKMKNIFLRAYGFVSTFVGKKKKGKEKIKSYVVLCGKNVFMCPGGQESQ